MSNDERNFGNCPGCGKEMQLYSKLITMYVKETGELIRFDSEKCVGRYEERVRVLEAIEKTLIKTTKDCLEGDGCALCEGAKRYVEDLKDELGLVGEAKR